MKACISSGEFAGRFRFLLFPFHPPMTMNEPTPQPEDGPEPQQPPRSTKEQETGKEASWNTSRLEVDALRAMLGLPPQAESRERREDAPERSRP